MRQEIVIFFVITCALLGCQKREVKIIQKSGEIISKPEQVQKQPQAEKEAVELAAYRGGLKTNPFLSREEEEYFKQDKGQLLIENMTISAIFYSPQRRSAIIDGRIVKEGDRIGDKTIIQIGEESVVLRDEESEYLLKLEGVAP